MTKNKAIVFLVIIAVLGCHREVEVRPREPEVEIGDQDFFGITPDQKAAAKNAEGILKHGSEMTQEDSDRLKELSEKMNKGDQ